MDRDSILCIIFSLICGLISIIFFFRIRANKNQLFLSLRSSNILQITNISIGVSLIIVIFLFLHLKKINKFFGNFIYNFYLFVQLILFLTIIFKYHRLVICSAINYLEDDLENFKSFKIEDYYFQYFFVRILFIISVILLILTFILSYVGHSLEPLFYLINEGDTSFPIIIWALLFAIENSLLFVYALFIFKKDLQAHLKLEILLLVILNVIYSLTIAFDFFDVISAGRNYEQYITIIYFVLLQLLTIFWPIWSCRVDDISTTYNLTQEVAHDLYLCLANEKSYNKFENYLKEDIGSKDMNLQAIELYSRIMKYRLSFCLNENKFSSSLKKDIREINEKFLLNKKCLDFQDKNIDETYSKFESIKSDIKQSIVNGEFKNYIFDKLLELTYDYLLTKFQGFVQSENYIELITEIGYETYIRCKLTNCGLMKK